MKKLFSIFVLLFVTGLVSAQTRTWTGLGSSNSFSEAANWSTGVAPTSTNSVLFNSTSTKSCVIDASVTVTGFTIASGYTGTISGSTFPVVINGSYAQADGTFNAPSDSLSIIGGQFNRTAGTFNHNSGNVIIAVNSGGTNTTNVNGSPAFNRLILRAGFVSPQQKNINFSSGTSTNTLSIQNGSLASSYNFLGQLSIASQLDLRSTGLTNPSPNSATFTIGGAGNFSITSQTSAGRRDVLPNLVFNCPGNIHLENTISLSGNWTHITGTFVPGAASATYFYSNCTISGNGNQFGELGAGQGTLTIAPGIEVRVSRNFVRASSLAALNAPSTSIIGFNGTGTQLIRNQGGAANPVTFGSVRIYNSGTTRSVTFNDGPFFVTDSIKIDGGNTTLGVSSTLTLQSTASLKGRIARIGAGGAFTGSVTVRTFIPGGTTGWANVGVPGVANQTVRSWDTFSTSAGTTGLPMTCSGCSWDENSVSGGPFHSIQNWTESTSSYGTMAGTTPLSRGIGYWLYVGTGPTTSNALTLVNTGTVVQGNVNVSVTNSGGGFNLVANPYASPINWATVFAASTNIANAIYIWNADLNTTTSFVSGVSSHVAGANNVIPAGQGFHVQAIGGGASVNFTEGAKIHNNTGANPLLRGSSNSEDIGDVFRLKLASSSSSDYMAFRVHNQASEGFDTEWDALKRLQSPGYPGYPGPYTKYTTLSSKDKYGVDYSIHSIAPPTSSVSIPVMARVETSGTYSIEAIDAENAGACLYIKDKVTGLTHNLAQSAYVFTISDTTQAPRFELLLCPRYAMNPNSIAELIKDNSVQVGHENGNLLVKTNYASTTAGTISVFNLLGQQVIAPIRFNEQSQLHTIAVEGSNDVLVVRITSEEGTVTRKVMMK